MGCKTTLAVCMIVRDEAARLSRALESVRAVAHEVIVVDTGSRDNTMAVARALGARVLETPWIDDFGAARNVALAAAHSDWVLSLDADEELAPGQKAALVACLARRDVDAWNVLLRSKLGGAQAGLEFQHQFPRLFRNGLGIRFAGRVHEQLRASMDAAAARVQTSGIVLVHSGYDIDARTRKSKLERNLKLLQLDHAERPGDGFLHFHLGETWKQLGKLEEAVLWYQRALSSAGLDCAHRATAHQNLASVLLLQGRLREAALQALRALRTDRDALPAWLHLSAARIRMGHYERGVRCASTYLKRTTHVSPETRRLGFTADTARAWLMIGEGRLRAQQIDAAAQAVQEIRAVRPEWAACERLAARVALVQERHAEAVECLRRGAEWEPGFAAGWCELVRVLADAGDLHGALAAINDAAAQVEDPTVYRMQGMLRLRSQDLAAAVQSYENLLRLDGNAEDAHRRLTGLYRRLGDEGRARRHLEWLQRATERSAEAVLAG
jgi:tetratricopeptide (TPR) repeat protein